MLRWLRGRPISPSEFWAWFQAHSHEFRSDHLPAAQVKALWKMLGRFHPDLGWGIQPGQNPTDNWRLEISAEGKARLAAKAAELVDAAPELPGWEAVAFRQPQPEPTTKLQNKTLGPDDILWVEEGWDEERMSLTLFVPMESPIRADDLSQAGLSMLDGVLGEYLVITRVGNLDFKHISVAPGRAKPLRELLPHMLSQIG